MNAPEPTRASDAAAPRAGDGPAPAKLDELFAAAIALPEPERADFLHRACAGQTELWQELRSLFEAHESLGEFMGDGRLAAPDGEQPNLERAGERIGRYRLVERIGEGGFGTVWLAEQVEPVVRRVALKIIKPGMDTREVIARFESERQALALMEHEHIARVFDAGATQFGRPYFVMELVPGTPITAYCDAAGLDTRERLALFQDVCAAIDHAHQKGVIHRDIKPSNVLVTLDGARAIVKVIDFGIAKATEGRLTDQAFVTRIEQFVGTPAYMSPEQANRNIREVDTRSDIYSLGALLYELLTGCPPFDPPQLAAAGYEELRRILGEVEPPRPSARLRTTAGEERARLAQARRREAADLPRLVEPDLDWIVMKSLEKDRARRYQTVDALAQDVAHFLADRPVSARPPSRAYLFRKFARRHRGALRIGAGILLLLLTATAVSTWQAVRATRAEAIARTETARANRQLQRADAEAERAQDQLYLAQMHLGLQTWREHRGQKALRDLLAFWRPESGGTDRRGWEWRYLHALFERDLRTLQPVGSQAGPSSLAWHAGSGRLAEGTVKGIIRIWDVGRSVVTETLQGPIPQTDYWGGRSLAWDPAGHRLAAAGQDGTVRVWKFPRAAAGAEGHLWRTKAGPLCAVAFSSDGTRLAAWSTDGRITLWEAETGEVRAEIVHPGAVTSAAWSPDDRCLASGHADGTVTFSAPEPGAACTTLAAQADEVYDLAWSPDSARLATTGANDFAVTVWEVATRTKVLGPLRHSHGIAKLAWEPRGRRIASGSFDETVKLWDATTGQEEATLRGLEGSVTALAWGPDGQLAAGEGYGGLKVWKALRNQERDVLPNGGSPVTAVAWSPVGGWLAGAGDDGRIRLWQPPESAPRREIAAHDERGLRRPFGLVRSLAWSPDGRLVASAGCDGTARIWEAATGRVSYTLPGGHGAYWCLAWSPDGSTLAAGAEDGTVQLAEGFPGVVQVRSFLAHPRSSPPDPGGRDGVRTLAWSPRGDRLATGGWDRQAIVWDPARGLAVQRLQGHSRAVLSVQFSPDGQLLATGSADFVIRLCEVSTGQVRHTLRGHNDFVDAVRWSPDGHRLASAGLDDSVRLWNPRTGRETFVLRGNGGRFHDLAWSPDGTRLAAASSDGQLWIWTAAGAD